MPAVSLAYRPYEDVSEEANVIVDGTATGRTTLTLSHWPGSPDVPADVAADLSAQMAFRYLAHPASLHGDARAVSNNHFDQDGLVGVFALVQPEEALARRAVLEDLAAAGDFGTYRFRAAARASMVIAALADAERSPFGPLPGDGGARTAHLYAEVLGRVTELVDHVERYRPLWADEDRLLDESEAAVAEGLVTIDERPDVDLAVVVVPDAGCPGGRGWWGHRFGGYRYDGVHPMAIHNATDRSALLLIAEGSYRFTYRYEGWVKYRSRPIPRRVALDPLAAALTAADTVAWHGQPVGVLTPELAPADAARSSLAPDVVVDAVVEHLRTAPPAFDPFA